MAVQPRPPEAVSLPAERPVSGPTAAPPFPPAGPVVELTGRRVGGAVHSKQRLEVATAVETAVLPHQLHELDQVVEIARLCELLVEKDARIALLERGIGTWRDRLQTEMSDRRTAEHLAFERERELVGVIHQQLTTIDEATANAKVALTLNDELQARLDDQAAAVQSSEQTSQSALARMYELQARIDELEEQLRRASRRWWRRRTA